VRTGAKCVGIAPDVFELAEEGKAVVKDATPADECPAKAIVLEE